MRSGFAMYRDDDGDETIPCPNCRAPVYEDAERCPRCGTWISEDDRLPEQRPVWFWIALALALLAFGAFLLL
ncbi:MAG: hypothetical protein AAB215_01625 [Planctomycetota bacterium]